MTRKVTVDFICDSCGAGGAERYYLRRYNYRRGSGDKNHSNPGVGGMDLCTDCVIRLVTIPPRKRRARKIEAVA